MKLIIGIPTMNRNSSLKLLLDDLFEYIASKKNHYISTSILIADNSPNLDAKHLIDNVCKNIKIDIEYLHIKELGIPYVRNSILAKAKDNLLLFLDDDTRIRPSSIENLLEYYENTGAPIIVSKNIITFDGQNNKKIFRPNLHESTKLYIGDIITSGLFLDLQNKSLQSIIFNTKLQFIGGSDYCFGIEVKEKNIPIAYCAECEIEEKYNGERATLAWDIKRHYRYGATFSYINIYILTKPNFEAIFKKIIYTTGKILIDTILALLGKRNLSSGLLYFSNLCGLLLGALGLVYHEYKRS